MSKYIILKKPSKVGKIVGFIEKAQVGKTGSPTLVPTLLLVEAEEGGWRRSGGIRVCLEPFVLMSFLFSLAEFL